MASVRLHDQANPVRSWALPARLSSCDCCAASVTRVACLRRLGPVLQWRAVPRRYFLELPFAALVKNTEQVQPVLRRMRLASYDTQRYHDVTCY